MAFSGTSLDEVFGSFQRASGSADVAVAVADVGTYLERRIRERGVDITKSKLLIDPTYDPVTLDTEKLVSRYNTLCEMSTNLEKALTEARRGYDEYINMEIDFNAISNEFQKKTFSQGDESSIEDFNKWRSLQAAANTLRDDIVSKHKSKLETRLSEIKEKLDTVVAELNVIRNFIKTGVKELVPSDEIKPNMCIICLDNTISHALVPCGHTLCKECCDKIEEDCPSCRSQMTEVLKIFL
jgi:hypothetical protein